tara:strand:- start:100797 stop:101024 length:228 start_codon:yes stop_codon:yes gene_type:complete
LPDTDRARFRFTLDFQNDKTAEYLSFDPARSKTNCRVNVKPLFLCAIATCFHLNKPTPAEHRNADRIRKSSIDSK